MYREGEEQSGLSYLPARSPDNRFPENLENRTDGQLPGNVIALGATPSVQLRIAAKRDEKQTMTVIAMTREIGSLGTVVAERLAARLGLKVIHSEVVAEGVAERLGVEAGAVLRYVNGSATLLERWQIDRRRLFRYAAEEVLRLAQQGNVLIKGWGAATLLRDMPHVISVASTPAAGVPLVRRRRGWRSWLRRWATNGLMHCKIELEE
jgi:hypothetical protein